MTFLKHSSIRFKMIVMMVVTSSLALLTACGALLFFQSVTLRQDIVRDLSALSDIISTQSTAAVAFNDQQAAGEILKALKVKPEIVSAIIMTPDGKTVATYGAPEQKNQVPARNGVEFRGPHIFLTKGIELHGEAIGALQLQADYLTTYKSLLTFYGGLLAAVTLVSILLITLLSAFIQRGITKPVLQLAETAASIANDKDYSLRAEKVSEDEIGGLTEAFNFMLTEIQAQDKALKESRERFEVAVSGSRDGIWDWNLSTNEVYYSPRWKSMLGYEEGDIEPIYDEFARLLHPEDKLRVINHLHEYLESDRASYDSIEFRMLRKDGDYCWIMSRGAAQRHPDGRPYRIAGSHTDITERKRAEQELAELNQQLLDISRQAGMADVATGVLHNVGNVLNSVNISATLVAERIRGQKQANLARAVNLLNEHVSDATAFLTLDARGKVLPGYLKDLADFLLAEQQENLKEIVALTTSVEHIKEIVAMQQSYARISGAMARFDIVEIIEDAMKINLAGFSRHHVRLIREFEETPTVLVDRHKTLQILINLLNNAKHALDGVERPDKCLSVKVWYDGQDMVNVSVTDNGVGIPKDNLVKIFSHGFTTRAEGHGFGLHSGANAAKEMGGSMSVASDGPGTGATFTLRLPIAERQSLQQLAAL